MRNFVRILNPAAGEASFTTHQRAEKLCRQRRATMIDGALRLVERVEITRLQRERNERADTAAFDRDTRQNCQARVWRTEHSGPPLMPGAPILGVRQFVEIPATAQDAA